MASKEKIDEFCGLITKIVGVLTEANRSAWYMRHNPLTVAGEWIPDFETNEMIQTTPAREMRIATKNFETFTAVSSLAPQIETLVKTCAIIAARPDPSPANMFEVYLQTITKIATLEVDMTRAIAAVTIETN